jgi:hypothetical protein
MTSFDTKPTTAIKPKRECPPRPCAWTGSVAAHKTRAFAAAVEGAGNSEARDVLRIENTPSADVRSEQGPVT